MNKQPLIYSVFALLALWLIIGSCSESEVELQEQELSQLRSYLESNNINAEPTASGLYFIPGRTGFGPAVESGDTVIMHFKESLLSNDKVIRNTQNDETPYKYVYKEDNVIAGFEEGVGYMYEGSSATLIIPSELAYGNVRNGPIPPYSTLIFEIYILELRKP